MTEPNRALLHRTVTHIRENPDSWNQAIYRALTPWGMVGCYASWACQLAGGIWHGVICLEAEPDDDPRLTYRSGALRVIDVDHRARRVLGLTPGQAEDLFHPSNNLRYIEQAVRELCDGTAPDWPDEETRVRRELHGAVDHIEPRGATK